MTIYLRASDNVLRLWLRQDNQLTNHIRGGCYSFVKLSR